MQTAILDKPQNATAKTNGASAPRTTTTPFVTPGEYLRRERRASTKHEYRNGVIQEMSGASYNHTVIGNNVGAELRFALKPRRDCKVSTNDIRVYVQATKRFYYPDSAVICGDKAVFYPGVQPDTLLNPTALVEVLSPSTEATDRGRKFADYQTLPSFREYVLVSQEEPRVEVYTRKADDKWEYQIASGIETSITLPALGITLLLAEIYDKIDFPALPDADEMAPEETDADANP